MQSLDYHDVTRPLISDEYYENEESSSVAKPNHKWYLELASIFFFVKGSTLYLICSISDHHYALQQMGLPPELRGVDDDAAWRSYQGDASMRMEDDDYIEFASERVTWYQILYFFAAFSFVVTGILDMVEDRAAFHSLMVLAGAFGVASSIYIESDEKLSNILDCVSVHLFLFEGLALFESRRELSEATKWYRGMVLFANGQFLLGSLIDVVVRVTVVTCLTLYFSSCYNCTLLYSIICKDVIFYCASHYRGLESDDEYSFDCVRYVVVELLSHHSWSVCL